MQTAQGSGGGGGGEENTVEAEILKLRGRWELASVLNFLDVFRPILDKNLKVSAEELEIGLVKPDAALTQLHVHLLKGIPPVSKALVESDKWVTVLCKKLTSWWPWVAEGKIPLLPSKGEEISMYKELNPSDRLVLLKALCEVRADQNDAVSYINDALKEGIQLTSFRKDALGRDGTGTSYWYDANAKCQSHRLYREIIRSDSNPKVNGCSSLPDINVQWETLASNHEEFSKAVEKFKCSTCAVEFDIGKKLQSDAIPVLEKLRKKKERAAKLKQRQDMLLLNDFRNSFCSGNTRSCRLRRPISYTYEAYDRTIKEAIQLTKKRNMSSGTVSNSKRKISSSTDQDQNRGSEDKPNMEDISTDSDSDRDAHQMSESDDTVYEIENHGQNEDDDEPDSEQGKSEEHSSRAVSNPPGARHSKQIAGVPIHTVLESRGLATKQRLRQRPTRNSAIESIVIPDSDDDEAREQGKEDLSESN